jgi:predicted DNA-binding protein
MSRAEELLARAMADEDITDEPGVGQWQVTREPISASGHPEGEVMVGRSVRMPLAVYERVRAVADARRTSVSRLVRQWVDEGLQAAEDGAAADPVVELHRTIDAATRALQALENSRPAA